MKIFNVCKSIILILVLFLSLPSYALDRETKTEDDGFTWILVSDNGYRGAESTTGKVLVPLTEKFNWITYKNGLLEGTDTDVLEFEENNTGVRVIKNYVGFYTTSGTCIISPGKYDTVFLKEARDGIPAYFDITQNDKYGICDITGKVVIEPISYGYPSYKESGFEIKDANGEYVETGVTLPGHDPIAMCDKRIQDESDGFSWTKLRTSDWKYGALDSNGNILFPIGMDRIEYKAGKTTGTTGIFICRKNDAEGWYAANGFAFVPVDAGYTYIRPANYENYTIVSKGDKDYGVYEPTLGEVIPCGKYDYVGYDNDGYFRIEKDDKYGVADILGNEVVPTLYPFLSRDEIGISYTDDNGEDVYVYTGIFPETKERVSERFDIALKSSDNDEAIELYRNVILADPMGRYGYISYCYNNMGVAYERKGDKDTARNYYLKAVELDPNNDVAQRNLEIIDTPQSQPEEKKSGWDIVAGVLDAFSNAANTYNAYTYNQSSQYDDSQHRSQGSGSVKTKRTKPKGNAFAKSVNRRIGDDTYNNYVSQLINMSVYPSRYNDSQRRSIQSSMKSIRERHGFNKSPWEDWDGNPNNAPR